MNTNVATWARLLKRAAPPNCATENTTLSPNSTPQYPRQVYLLHVVMQVCCKNDHDAGLSLRFQVAGYIQLVGRKLNSFEVLVSFISLLFPGNVVGGCLHKSWGNLWPLALSDSAVMIISVLLT